MRNIYTVGQINSYIKRMFQEDFFLQDVSVRGEVSNCKYHTSGHIYFTLKDRSGTIPCIMFAGNRSGLSFRLTEGLQIVACGTVDVYERDGRYQVYVKSIEPDGEGALYEQFQRLKRDLMERGMFAPEYKKPIPKYVRTMGVVTASTGAAIRDIIHITKRRNPYVQILLYPAQVQGENAVPSIVCGIRALEEKRVDVIVVGRGGGSMEDLWAFNDEAVAQAVFDCSVPIISAVGHETDTTIIDFVADLRAPTPSAAAELAVYDYKLLQDEFSAVRDRMDHQMNRQILLQKTYLQKFCALLKSNRPIGKLREKKTYALQLEEQLQSAMQNLIQRKRHEMAILMERMKGLSPIDKLNQGYSYVADQDGNTVTDIRQVYAGEDIDIYVKNGMIHAKVLKTYRRELEAEE